MGFSLHLSGISIGIDCGLVGLPSGKRFTENYGRSPVAKFSSWVNPRFRWAHGSAAAFSSSQSVRNYQRVYTLHGSVLDGNFNVILYFH